VPIFAITLDIDAMEVSFGASAIFILVFINVCDEDVLSKTWFCRSRIGRVLP
jgi:hypothetical protein